MAMLRCLVWSGAAIACLLDTQAALSQAYPARAIRFIVPFSPGGASDTGARIIGQKLTERWGQQVIVENRPGAGGTIGTGIAAKAPPDGYTLLFGSSTELAVNPNLYPKLSYDTTRDFTPVALVSATAMLLVVHPSLPAASVKELVGLAKSRPGEILYASSGNGASTHLAPEMLKRQAAINMLHVPHNGSAPAVLSVVSGQTQVAIQALPAVLPQVEAGKLRALAVTSARRVAAAQHLPTPIEAGYPQMEIVIWNGVVAPAGTSKDIVSRLGTEILAILALAEVKQGVARQGAELTPAGPEQLGVYLKSELAKFAKVVRESGARID
jgi:tripartite-type tricarboxylate transporter receptor subunit TctC